jgi:tetratricopeptide (TPR) repeat protein
VAQLLEEAGEPSAALEAVGRVLSVDLSPDVARALLEVLDRVAPRVRGPGEPALVAGLRGRMHFERGNHGEARAGAEEARAGAEGSLRRGSGEERRVAAAQLHALHVLALMQVIEGRDTEEALRLSREAAAWAGRLEPDDAQAARLLEARLLIIASRSAEAVVLLEGCQGEDDAQLREATRWRGWLLLGDAYCGAGEPARSIAPCRRALAAMQEAGGHWLLGQGYNTLADALMRLRRFEEAIATLHLALGELYPRSPTAGYVRANLAFCHLLLGQREASARWIDDAFAHLPINSRHRLWCLLQSLRLPLLAATELAALDACCDELEAWLVGQRIAISEPMEAATLAAEALAADPPRAARLFALARRLAAHVEDPALVAALQPRWP